MIWTLPCFPNATLIITAVTNFAKIDFTLVQCLHLITINSIILLIYTFLLNFALDSQFFQ